MAQQTLFGEKPKPKEEPGAKKEYKPRLQHMADADEPETVSIGEKAKYGWKQLPDNETKKRLGYDVHSLDLFCHSDLNGKTYTVSHSSTKENPNNMMGSAYGCGGKCFDPKNLEGIKEFFNDLMETKKQDLTEPYRTFTKEEQEIKYKHHDLYYEFRLIPANQYYVVIGDELLKMLKEKGFDFEAWYKNTRHSLILSQGRNTGMPRLRNSGCSSRGTRSILNSTTSLKYWRWMTKRTSSRKQSKTSEPYLMRT